MQFVIFLLAAISPFQEDEIAQLRARVAAAERENRELKKQLEKAEAAGFAYAEDAVASVVEMAKSLPAELSPRGDWDNFKLQQAQDHLRDNFIGQTVKLKFELRRKNVSINSEFTRSRTGPKYCCKLHGLPKTFSTTGYRVVQRIQGLSTIAQVNIGSNSQWPAWYGDEEFKNEFERIRPNSLITVEGKISDVQLKKEDRQITITLSIEDRIYSIDCLNKK